jgi:hypothetical protein
MATVKLEVSDELVIVRHYKVETAGGMKDMESRMVFSYQEVVDALLTPKPAEDYKTLAGSFSRSVGIIARNVIRKTDPRGHAIDIEASIGKIREAIKTLPEASYSHVSEGALELLQKVNKKQKGAIGAELDKILQSRKSEEAKSKDK